MYINMDPKNIFKNIIIANKYDNKIIFPAARESIYSENKDTFFLDNDIINYNPSTNNKIIFALSDDLVDNDDYIFTCDIAIQNQESQICELIVSINDHQEVIQSKEINNIFETIKFNVTFKNPPPKIHNRLVIQVPYLNILNFSINCPIIKNIQIKNIRLVKEDGIIMDSNLEQYVIYHYQPNNTKENGNAYTYNQQAQKIRYICLKNLEKFKNKIVWIYTFDEIEFPFNNIIPDNSMFFCDDVVIPDMADKITEFCSLIGKNRYYFGYECPSHFAHRWKIDTEFLVKNFDHIYSSAGEYFENAKYYWIPGYHNYFFDYIESRAESLFINENCPKKFFMTNNPFWNSQQQLRINIIKEIRQMCDFYFYGKEPTMREFFGNKVINENPLDNEQKKYSLAKKDIFSQFKFVIVCENSSFDGYITEKLPDCLTCRSLPIYFGPKCVKKYFPDLFNNGVINGFDYTTDELINKLKNMDEEEYNNRINKIISLSKKIIMSFTECSMMTMILDNYFSKHNISILIPEGTKFLVDINKKLSQKHTISLVEQGINWELTATKNKFYMWNHITVSLHELFLESINNIDLPGQEYINNYISHWHISETAENLVFENVNTRNFYKPIVELIDKPNDLGQKSIDFKFWIIKANKEGFILYNKQSDKYYRLQNIQVYLNGLEPQNGDPLVSREIDRLIKLFKVNEIIETGTSTGATTKQLAVSNPSIPIHSIEIMENSYKSALSYIESTNLWPSCEFTITSSPTNVKLHLGSSEQILEKLLPTLEKNVKLFYLDAHWQDYWPELDEIKIIGKYLKDQAIIVIDDFKVPNRPYGYDTYKKIKNDFDYIKDSLPFAYSDYIYYYNNRTASIPWGGRGKIYIIPKKLLVEYGITETQLLHFENNVPYSNY